MNKPKYIFLLVGILLVLLAAVLIYRHGNDLPHGDHKAETVHIHLKAVEGLHYDKARFQVKPGATVILTLTNMDDMDHNIVFTKPNSREKVIKDALDLGSEGPEAHFVPASSAVLWHIPTVGPADSQTITFTVPERDGAYPYVCTYPGHGMTMYGVMYVGDKPLPPIADDPNIPAGQKADHSMHATHRDSVHPYTIIPPYLIRTFLPNSSPASMAVGLPDSLSYCWDAASCRLRYAWSGGFLNNADLWKRKGEEMAQIAGVVFFRDETHYPFRMGDEDSIPHVQFKGYSFVDRYPEFQYQINGIDIYELIKPKSDGSGLNRYFRIPKATQTIWFLKNPSNESAAISASAGKWEKNRLRLSPAEATHFTITITKKKEETP